MALGTPSKPRSRNMMLSTRSSGARSGSLNQLAKVPAPAMHEEHERDADQRRWW